MKGHVEANKFETSNTEVHNSLKQEVLIEKLLQVRDVHTNLSYNIFPSFIFLQILRLEERLQDQFVVRSTLEKALSHKPFTYDAAVENLIPKVISLVPLIIFIYKQLFAPLVS